MLFRSGFAQDDGADALLFEVQRDALHAVRELQHLAGHRALDAVHAGDSVADGDDAAHLGDVHLEQATVYVRGKGDRHRVVPLGDVAAGAVGRYLRDARPALARGAEDALFLSAGGYHHDLGFNTWTSRGGTPPPAGTTGLYHVAIRYPTREALGDALKRLVDADWPLDGVNDHGTHEALYLSDPDGNGLELCWDRPEDDWPLDAEGHLTMDHPRDVNRMVRELLALGEAAAVAPTV